MSKIIALDIGNVCLKIDKNSWINYLGSESKNLALIDKIITAKTNFELGIITQASFISELIALTGAELSENELISIYCSIINKEIDGMNELIHDFVKAGYRIIFFSDTSKLHLYEVFRRLSFSNLITGGVYSFEVGAYKPDIKMFQEFEKRYNKPDFYIDDIANNCSEAEKFGWKSHCFTSCEVCRKNLLDGFQA